MLWLKKDNSFVACSLLKFPQIKDNEHTIRGSVAAPDRNFKKLFNKFITILRRNSENNDAIVGTKISHLVHRMASDICFSRKNFLKLGNQKKVSEI